MLELALMVLGAAIGILLERLYLGFERKLQIRRATVRTSKYQVAAAHVSDHVLDIPDDLEQYVVSRLAREVRLPIATRPSWLRMSVLKPSKECPIVVPNLHAFREFIVDPRKITEIEKSIGRSIFPGEACYIEDLNQIAEGAKLSTIGRCNFLAYAYLFSQRVHCSLAGGHDVSIRMRQWDRHFLSQVYSAKLPLALGCTVALVHRSSGKWCGLQHRRAANLIVSPTTRSYLPVFGMEVNSRAVSASKYGIIQHNFLRELGEELFSLPELATAQENSKLDSDWFTQVDPLLSVIAAWKNDQFELHYVGDILNFTNANFQICLVAVHRAEEGWSDLIAGGALNWEIDSGEEGMHALGFREIGSFADQYASGARDISPAAVYLDDVLSRRLPTINERHGEIA